MLFLNIQFCFCVWGYKRRWKFPIKLKLKLKELRKNKIFNQFKIQKINSPVNSHFKQAGGIVWCFYNRYFWLKKYFDSEMKLIEVSDKAWKIFDQGSIAITLACLLKAFLCLLSLLFHYMLNENALVHKKN